VAKTSPGGIIIPEPGDVLLEAGASGALGDAAAEAIKDFIGTQVTSNALYKHFMPAHFGIDWGKDADMVAGSLDPKVFQNEYLGSFPMPEPDLADDPPIKYESPKGKPLGDVLFKDESPEVQAQLKAMNEAIFEHLSDPKQAKSAVDAVNAFTLAKMKEDGICKKIMPPLPISNDELEDYHNALEDYHEAKQKMAAKEYGLDIIFWYYRGTGLIYSLRRVVDNFFYDFNTRKFSVLPVVPRDTLAKSDEFEPCGYIYAARLAGKFADGEYVVTIRDAKADDVVVGIMAIFMKGGTQLETPEEGLEDTPIEEGLPLPEGIYRRRARRVRSIDVDET
jgi:hypothetical protein